MMAIALKALTVLLTLGFAVSQAEADVTVYRGSAVETVATGGSAPVILRGSNTMRTGAAKPAQRPGYAHVAAGDTLWLVDADGKALTACTLQNTGYTGRRKVVCTKHE